METQKFVLAAANEAAEVTDGLESLMTLAGEAGHTRAGQLQWHSHTEFFNGGEKGDGTIGRD